ncbi:hypothetical protein SARC_08384 [Sphaeroforma arctica JP610]|uniref:Uncharacterized protein n=1 Tax=Sphaeroforma arctica JP610 TaxID=667725 RepID=A0A0L0FR23_9EUKA|nr:hypothetical protein SARC_08384 [Sphaeroforma arctica JP610]KNC79215.1 hypothetical protein SARC_08384 [Sphaeroforma arctica JP610]|eukprot:XP_014153117.1 hypothetical protein SARC_08384 [Sphaeroforma arctica JP610]
MKDRAIPTSETKSNYTMGTVLKQDLEVATANTAAIARVTEKEDVKTLMYQFDVDVPGKYAVQEVEVMVHAPEYLESFEHPKDMKLCAFMDLFNDKIDAPKRHEVVRFHGSF